MSSFLITGAAGFIGSHTVELAVERGHQVRAVDAFNDYYDPDRKRANASAVLEATGVEVEQLDLRAADLRGLVASVDAVIHLAGQPGVRSSWSEFDGYQRDNVLVTEALWLASLVLLSTRRQWAPRHLTTWLIALWPFTYAAPHYVYDVWNYYFRHIVAFNLGLATSGLVLLGLRASTRHSNPGNATNEHCATQLVTN